LFVAKVDDLLIATDRFRGMGPGFRQDDNVWDDNHHRVAIPPNFNHAFTKLKRPLP